MTISEWCPTCGANIVTVTRGIPSMGTCSNGHMTDRRDVLRRPPVDPVALELAALRAELAQARADAQAAVALVVERAAENKEQLEIWAHEILAGLAFADVLKIDSYNDKIEAHDMVGRGLVEVIRALAPADGLAAVEALRVEARENAMQALASMGQAQEAYEAQLEAEAELARVRARGERLVEALEDIAKQKRTDELATEYDVECADFEGGYDACIDRARAALAQTPPADTWHERRMMLPDGDARKGEG